MKHTIDAKGKKLGRIASQAAALLIGKSTPTIEKNIVTDVKVEVLNASKLDLSAVKMRDTKYARYSGYPGGLRYQNMNDIVSKKGYSELIREAVSGMLPHNKLRSKMIRNLTVTE